jgi:hypothetical protein
MKQGNRSMAWLLCLAAAVAPLTTSAADVTELQRRADAAAAVGLRPSPYTAEQIVERSVRASGGLQAWRAIKTMTLSGLMDAGPVRDPTPAATIDQRLEKAVNRAQARKVLLEAGAGAAKAAPTMIQLPFVMEMKRGHKQRVEIQFQGQTAVQVYDGARGWKLRPFLNRHEVEDFTPEQARLAEQEQELDGPLVDYEGKGTRIAVEGLEAIDGGDAYKLKLTLKDGSMRHVWVDARSFLQVQVDGARRVNGHEVPVLTRLSDYRWVDGVMVPYVAQTQVQGSPAPGRIVLDKVAINAPLPDERFARPQ